MFKTLTWTIGFASALLAFVFVNLTNYDAMKAKVALTTVVIAAAAAGLVICLYSWFMLSESGKHIQANWDRADRCAKQVKDLERIIHGAKRRTPKTMKIWNQLRIIVVLFAVAFVVVLGWKITAA
jgi:hypothetical protein